MESGRIEPPIHQEEALGPGGPGRSWPLEALSPLEAVSGEQKQRHGVTSILLARSARNFGSVESVLRVRGSSNKMAPCFFLGLRA